MLVEHLHRIASHAYYAADLHPDMRRIGLDACERLLSIPLSPDMEQIVRRNRTWYTLPLSEIMAAKFYRIDCDPAHEGWSLFNPSLVAVSGGWLVNVRSSNYRIIDGKYVMPESDGQTIKTENIQVRLGDAFESVSQSPWWQVEYPKSDYPVDGLEDLRVNHIGHNFVASATIRNHAGLDGTCRIAVASCPPTTPHGYKLHVPVTMDNVHEKNWMPLLGREEWIYHCHTQGHVATAVLKDGSWVVTIRGNSPAIAKGFRGGSQLIPWDDGKWLALVHEVAHDDNRRIYEHRFVLFGDDMAIVGMSDPFSFKEHREIEFCAGLAQKGERVVASFGVRDAEAWLVEMHECEVNALLKEVA